MGRDEGLREFLVAGSYWHDSNIRRPWKLFGSYEWSYGQTTHLTFVSFLTRPNRSYNRFSRLIGSQSLGNYMPSLPNVTDEESVDLVKVRIWLAN